MQNRRTFLAQCGVAGIATALVGPVSSRGAERELPEVLSFVRSYGEPLRTFGTIDGRGAKTVVEVRVQDLHRFTGVFNGSPLPFDRIHCEGNRMQFESGARRVELVHRMEENASL